MLRACLGQQGWFAIRGIVSPEVASAQLAGSSDMLRYRSGCDVTCSETKFRCLFARLFPLPDCASYVYVLLGEEIATLLLATRPTYR